MLITRTKSGIEVIINPAHVAAASVNADETRVELSTGKTYTLPVAAWPEVKKSLNGGNDQIQTERMIIND